MKFGFKRIMALAAAVMIASGAVGDGFKFTTAEADWYGEDYYGDYGDYGGYTDYGGYSDYGTGYGDYGTGYGDYGGYYDDYGNYIPYDPNQTWTGDDGTGTVSDSSAADISDSSQADDSSSAEPSGDATDAEKAAGELVKKVGKVPDIKVKKASTEVEMRAEEKTMTALRKKESEIDKEISLLNSSMSLLQIEINTNRRALDEATEQVEEGKEHMMKRLRAMYLAGTDSYTTVILESDSFYDVLMRMELLKRVAEHDDAMLDELVALQKEIEASQKVLDARQTELDEQMKEFDEQKKKLDKLYASSEQAKELLEKKELDIRRHESEFKYEDVQVQTDFGAVFAVSTGELGFDEEVAQTEAKANLRLAELHKNIKDRKKAGEKLDKYEPTYTFMWPVPQSYLITSGVGSRWGTYHKGMDIGGAQGYDILASESGKVIMMNDGCPHNWPKDGSCGCGGGFGNFVILDHGNDFITVYGHMADVKVKEGQVVGQGEVIGHMGTTGYSTGEHLHFELRYQGYIVDPSQYVDLSLVGSSDAKNSVSEGMKKNKDKNTSSKADTSSTAETTAVTEADTGWYPETDYDPYYDPNYDPNYYDPGIYYEEY